jgi:hypothetical protein
MRQDMHLADAWGRRDLFEQRLQRVPRSHRAVLVRDITEQFVLRRPREQYRHAAEAAVRGDLRRAHPHLLETVVEAVDEDENVPVDADAAGDVRGEFRLELVVVERAFSRDDDMLLGIGGTPARSLDRARLMRGRQREGGEREMGPVRRGGLRRGAGFALPCGCDEHLDDRGSRRRH